MVWSAGLWAPPWTSASRSVDQLAPLTRYPAYVQVGGYLVLVLALVAGWPTAFMRREPRAVVGTA